MTEQIRSFVFWEEDLDKKGFMEKLNSGSETADDFPRADVDQERDSEEN